MANDVETEARPSLTHLVGGIVQDAQQLARQQLTLFQVELKNDIRRTARGAIPLVAGIFVCLIGASAAALAVAHLLPTIWPRLPLWGGHRRRHTDRPGRGARGCRPTVLGRLQSAAG